MGSVWLAVAAAACAAATVSAQGMGLALGRQRNVEGLYLRADTQFENGFDGEEHTDFLELDGGITLALNNLGGRQLRSGQDHVTIASAVLTQRSITIDDGASVTVNPGRGGRKRRATVGTRKVLAVRVRSDCAGSSGGTGGTCSGPTTTSSEAVIGNYIFGTDNVNLKNQYAACSNNQLIMEKGTANPWQQEVGSDGVVEVDIGITASGATRGNVENAVTAALNLRLPNFLNEYDHVMYCLPPGTSGGWIAYAYINSWRSVYNDLWCEYVSGQMHEIGHNLGLAHSNEGATTYADQTGMMGYSYGSHNTPVMCFNNAKNWQLGWYQNRHATWTLDDNAVTTEYDLVGIAHYANSVAGQTVVLKVERGNAEDYYVGFNRKVGLNSGTAEGGNQVTVQLQGGEGSSYSESNLQRKMIAGASFKMTSSAGTEGTITVLSLATSGTPSVARVRVCLGDYVATGGCSAAGPPPTPAPPTPPPTPVPTAPPTLSPTGQPTDTPCLGFNEGCNPGADACCSGYSCQSQGNKIRCRRTGKRRARSALYSGPTPGDEASSAVTLAAVVACVVFAVGAFAVRRSLRGGEVRAEDAESLIVEDGPAAAEIAA